MSGVVSFIIKAQDSISAPLARITGGSGKATTALQKLSESNKQLSGMLGNTGNSVTTLSNKIATLQRQKSLLPSTATEQLKQVNEQIVGLNSQMQKLQATSGGAGFIGRMKSGIIGNAKAGLTSLPGAGLLTNPLVAGGALLAGAASAGVKDAKARSAFRAEGGDDKTYLALRRQSAVVGGSMESGKSLLNAGYDPNKVSDTVTRLGAVSGGSEDKLGALSAAFAQVSKDGKLTESTLQSMNDVGFKPLTTLADKYNVKLGDLQKMLTDGRISMDMLNEALETATDKGGEFGDVLSNRMNDPSVKLNLALERITGVISELGIRVLPLVSVALDFVAKGFDYVGVAADWAGSTINSVTGFLSDHEDVVWAVGAALGAGVVAYKAYEAAQVISYMWTMRSVIADTAIAGAKGLLAIATGGATAAQWALNAAFFASPIGWIVGGFAAITGAVVLAWNKFEGFRKAVMGVWESTKAIFHNVAKFLGIESGDYESIGEAYGRGAAKCAASWKADKEKKEKGGALGASKEHFEVDAPVSEVPGHADGKQAEQVNAVSGGGAKTYNVNIGSMIQNLTQHVSGGQEAGRAIEAELEVALARVFQSLR